MKIAQMSHAKIQKNNARNKKIEFSKSLFGTSNDPDSESKNEIDILFQEVEDIIKVINLRGFTLTEANPKKYNKGALKEYYEVINMYKDTLERIQNKKKTSLLKRKLFVTNVKKILCVCYNNIGCLWYSLRKYGKACNEFEKSNMLEEMIENENISEKELTMTSIVKLNMEKCARRLNHCLALTKYYKGTAAYLKYKDQYNCMSQIIAEIKLGKILNSFKGSSIYSEIEILSICTLINCKLTLLKFEECAKLINHLNSMIDFTASKENKRLSEITSQYKYYLQAKFEIMLLKSLIQSKNKLRLSRSESFESSFSILSFDDISNYSKSDERKFSRSINSKHRYNDLVKHHTSALSKNLILALFSTKIIDPEVYSLTIDLLKEFYILKTKNSNKALEQISKIYDFEKKWNLIVCYNPKFVKNYNKALSYLNIIKESLSSKDLISIFVYEDNKLDRVVDRAKVSYINFEDCIDTFLLEGMRCNRIKFDDRSSFLTRERHRSSGPQPILPKVEIDKLNFFHRFNNYLNCCHFDTENIYTSEDEWEEIQLEAIEFIDRTRFDNEENNLKIQIFLIIFKDSSQYNKAIEILYKQEIKLKQNKKERSKKHRSSYVHMNSEEENANKNNTLLISSPDLKQSNRKFMNHKCNNQNNKKINLKSMFRINPDSHPISIIDVGDCEFCLLDAVKQIGEFVRISKHCPLRMSFQDILI